VRDVASPVVPNGEIPVAPFERELAIEWGQQRRIDLFAS